MCIALPSRVPAALRVTLLLCVPRSGEARERVRAMQDDGKDDRSAAEQAGDALSEGARRVKEGAWKAYVKVADQFGSRR
jgi:hypothetical protein